MAASNDSDISITQTEVAPYFFPSSSSSSSSLSSSSFLPGRSAETDHASLDSLLETTRVVIQRFISVIVVIFGTVGNLISIAVLTRPSMKSSTNRYLTALAVYDTLYLLFALTMTFNRYDLFRGAFWYNHYHLPFGRPLTDICSNTGVWLTLTFTFERYIGVCYPMKGKVWCTARRAQYVILAVCLAAFLVTLPEFFELRVTVDDNSNGVLTTKVELTSFGESPAYKLGYQYANQVLFTFLPLLLLLCLNSLLIRTVMFATRNRRRMTLVGDGGGGLTSGDSRTADRNERQHRDQQRITVMLIVVVIVFLVCQLPQAVHTVCRRYLEWAGVIDPYRQSVLRLTANYFNLLVMINSSVNFVLYSSCSTKFRTTFLRTVCRSVLSRIGKGGYRPRSGSDSAVGISMLTNRRSSDCVINGGNLDARRRTLSRPSVGDLLFPEGDPMMMQRRRSRSQSIGVTGLRLNSIQVVLK